MEPRRPGTIAPALRRLPSTETKFCELSLSSSRNVSDRFDVTKFSAPTYPVHRAQTDHQVMKFEDNIKGNLRRPTTPLAAPLFYGAQGRSQELSISREQDFGVTQFPAATNPFQSAKVDQKAMKFEERIKERARQPSMVTALAPVQSFHAITDSPDGLEPNQIPDPRAAALARSRKLLANIARAREEKAAREIANSKPAGAPSSDATEPSQNWDDIGSRPQNAVPSTSEQLAATRSRAPRFGSERPAALHSSGRAASASILKKPSTDLCFRYQKPEAYSSKTLPLATPLLPNHTWLHHPHQTYTNPYQAAPSSPPRQPPAFLQYSYDDWKEHQAEERKGKLPASGSKTSSKGNLPTSTSKSSTRPSLENNRPVTPAANTADDEPPLSSRWSPDTPPEESRIKKVRKALSFSRLRMRKSKANLRKGEGEPSNLSLVSGEDGGDVRSSTASEGSRRKSGGVGN
ncbi:hypothetical protein N0V88_005708 [Collariella sp. IMI 366227]|nr:hypothetical protein N0V88_005708 [Collariella sp. IMI 366227]